MRLFVAEKPNVARDIAAALGASKRQDGYIEGDDVLITWAFGHLVQIAEPEAMNSAWGNPWRLDQLPMIPGEWLYGPTSGGAKQLANIKRLMADKRVDVVVAATDADREGERIFRLIYQLAGCKKPIKRLWLSSTTDDAIHEAIAQLRDGREYEALAAAAEARGRADWVVGLNCTRAYTLRNGQKCTVGRVQTPTLALVVRRQRAIEQFKPQSYWQLTARLADGDKKLTALYVDQDQQPRINAQPQAEQIAQQIRDARVAQLVELETKEVVERPPLLYDLNNLQLDANRKWGYTAAEVLESAQALYEEHKLSTYPRTGCRYISTDLVPQLPKIIQALSGAYPAAAARAAQRQEPLGKPYVDDKKLTAHHALLPTPVDPKTRQLPEREARIYDLIARRFLAVFLPPKRSSATVALFKADTHALRARGSVPVDPGWTVVYADQQPEPPEPDDKQDEPEQQLPALERGRNYDVTDVALAAGSTKPPRPYNDGTLIKAMEHAGQDLDDKDLRQQMAATGLGTMATRGEIIEKLIRTEYLERAKKILRATPKGCALIDQVHPDLADPATTARWEARLAAIEDGTDNATSFERDIAAYVRDVVATIATAEPIARLPEPGLGPCPVCKQGTVSETPKAFGCSRWREGCKFAIWKQLAGKTITAKVATELLLNGRTSRKIAGFASKAGKPFEAKLRLDENHKVAFVFDN